MANLYDKAGLVNIPVGYQEGFLYNIKPEDNTLGFRFNRDSAATLVNSKGLIEQVGYFGPELVQNGNFSELGSELVVNGDFASGTSPFEAYQCNLSNVNNTLVATATTANDSRVKQPITTISGKSYKITADLLSLSGTKVGVTNTNGNLFSYAGDNNERTTSGQFTFFFTAESTTTSIVFKMFDASIGESFSIDNVSVKQVDPNDYWTSVGGSFITFPNGVLNSNNTDNGSWFAEYVAQNIPFVNGKLYKVSFKARNISGDLNLRINQNANIIFSSNLTSEFVDYIVYYTANADNGSIRLFCNDSVGQFEIDNISVVEILGDKPRIDYTDSLTSPSFLLEPQSTNLITQSNTFTAWSKEATVVLTANYGISPDGTQNSTRMQMNANDSIYISTTSGKTASVYVKGIKGETIRLSNGSALMHTLSGEWDRIQVYDSGSNSSLITINTYSGATSRDIQIFGAQAEALSYATSYIPTAGSTATRTQETCVGAGNVSTFNSTEGVLYAEMASLADDGTTRYVSVSDGANQNAIAIRFSDVNNQILAYTRIGGVFNAVLFTSSYSTVNFNKIAYRYKSGDSALFINGTKISSSTSTQTLPSNTLNTLAFNDGLYAPMQGKVKSVYVFNEALTDDELQQLTGPEYNSFAALAAAYNYTVI